MSLPVSGAKEALLQRILAAHAAAQQQEQEQGQQQEQQQKQQQPGPSDAAAGASPLPVAAVVADAVQQRKRASAAQAQEGASGEGGAGSQLDKGAGGEEEVDVGAAGPAAGGSSQYDIRPGTQALEEHMASAKVRLAWKLIHDTAHRWCNAPHLLHKQHHTLRSTGMLRHACLPREAACLVSK